MTNDRSVINTYRDKNEVKGAADQGNRIVFESKQQRHLAMSIDDAFIADVYYAFSQ